VTDRSWKYERLLPSETRRKRDQAKRIGALVFAIEVVGTVTAAIVDLDPRARPAACACLVIFIERNASVSAWVGDATRFE